MLNELITSQSHPSSATSVVLLETTTNKELKQSKIYYSLV